MRPAALDLIVHVVLQDQAIATINMAAATDETTVRTLREGGAKLCRPTLAQLSFEASVQLTISQAKCSKSTPNSYRQHKNRQDYYN